MRFATYNLRYDALPDNLTVKQSLEALSAANPLQEPKYFSHMKEQPWSLRRLRVAELLLRKDVTVIGFQEALIRQVHDLAELLGHEWKWIGVGRDDGAEKGEFSPIFYKHTELRCISFDSFWLSTTPFEPSKYPGAGSFRICTVGRFETINTDNVPSNEFTIFNTHLDEQSDAQRRLAASLLLQRARFEAVNTKAPVFVLGDFNSTSTGSDSGAYCILTGAIPPVLIPLDFAKKFDVDDGDQPDFKFVDLRGETPPRTVSSNFATFTGFNLPNDTKDWARIDFIFGGSNKGWNVKQYEVQTSLFDDGVLASDHRPVSADVELLKI